MTIDRRTLIQSSSALLASTTLPGGVVFGQADTPIPKSNRFLLYIHMGSSCGAANGLHQPLVPGKWPSGFFQAGVQANANNPLMNSHTQAGGLVLHDYIKFLAPMADDMCLVSGTSQTLTHQDAANLQKRGAVNIAVSPEWAMGVGQFMKTSARPNPIVLTNGNKTVSVGDITTVAARSIDEFKTITTDPNSIPKGRLDPMWETLRKRFATPGLKSVITEKSLEELSTYQLKTLRTGLPELANIDADVNALKALLGQPEISKLVDSCGDKSAIIQTASGDQGFKDKLILAGILAKTGVANGMTIEGMGDDAHGSGTDVVTTRNASAKWAAIAQFWKWIRASNLQDDVMIIVSHEFGRSPYNLGYQDMNITNAEGKTVTVRSPGRDHGLSLGMMFINANVPKAGRVGYISDNFAPVATKDAKGTFDTSAAPYTAENMVGSMLLRVYGELFPTERMVRKHWPTFKEIGPITA